MTRRHTHHSVEKLGDRGPNEHDDPPLHTLGAVQLLSPRLIILLVRLDLSSGVSWGLASSPEPLPSLSRPHKHLRFQVLVLVQRLE